MTRVLVVYGSRHGATQGIAERIGEVLREERIDAVVKTAAAATERDVRTADAVVVGSGVYMGSWLDAPLDFMRHNEAALAARPLWMFSSGPLPGSSKDKHPDDPIENALGPVDGPGSGGRKKVEAVSAATGPLEHRVFLGKYDPDAAPANLPERVMRTLMHVVPSIRDVLPAGDFREWPQIEAWARRIAEQLGQPVSATQTASG